MSLRRVGILRFYMMRFASQTRAINWKLCSLTFLGGALVSFNEVLLEAYALLTDSKHNALKANELKNAAKRLPVYMELSSKPSWKMSHSWEGLERVFVAGSSAQLVRPSLTNTTLAKKGGILIEPTIFHNSEENTTVTIVHVGDRLCGYPFLVHGGILATILNETFKRNAALSPLTRSALKDDFKVNTLGISYKSPSLADQFLIITTKLTPYSEVDGTSTSDSKIEDSNGKLLVQGHAVIKDTGRASRMEAGSEASKWVLF